MTSQPHRPDPSALDALARRFDELSAARAEQQRLTRRLVALDPQLREAGAEVDRLAGQREKEEADVRRLEGGSLSPSRLWASVRGDSATRLDRERAEAQAAVYAHSRAVAQHDELLREERGLRAALDASRAASADYEQVLSEVARLAQGPEGAALRDRAVQAGRALEDLRWRRELDEALLAGEEAHDALTQARARLGSASGYSAWDMFAGGGMLASMLKHGELDKATDHLDGARAALQRFSRELADVELPGVEAPVVDTLSRGLDIWADNFLADALVGERIRRATAQVDEAIAAVAETLATLRQRRAALGD